MSYARYQDTSEINRGGMGAILRGQDPLANREVAIKIVPTDAHASQELMDKFLLEARVTAQLEHPNIIPIYEVDRTGDGRPFFTMKRVRGKSLAELLPTAGTSDLLEMFLKVCDAISYAHGRGVVHRDIKPDNIMVGEFGEVLVLDWGVARVMGERDLIPDGSVVGTPAYMPPEQAKGNLPAIGTHSDVYALGAVLYEILTLRPPFEGERVWTLLDRVVEEPVTPPSERSPDRDVPWELEAIVRKAMAKRPNGRYRDVPRLARDVAAYLAGEPVSVARYSTAGLAAMWIRRHRAVTAAVAIVLLFSVASLIVLQLMARRDLTSRAADAAREASAQLAAAPDAGTPEQRAEAIAAHLSAAGALERALALTPDDQDLLARRRKVGESLGRLAISGGDFVLARHALGALERFGATAQQIEEQLDGVERARTGLLRARRERLDEMLAQLAGETALDDRAMDDLILQAAGYRDAQTVSRLVTALTPMVERAASATQTLSWTDAERRTARFVTGVLGRSQRSDAIPPLGRWIAALHDADLVVEAGLALCNTRSAAAHPHLIATRNRVGLNSETWSRIAVAMNRVPEPASVTDTTPDTPRAFFERGLARLDQGQYRLAIDDFTEVLRREPRNVGAWSNRGLAHSRTGEPKRASEDYTRAIALAPREASLYVNRGVARVAAGDRKGALDDYDKAISINASEVLAFQARGGLRKTMGDLEGALSDLDRAVELRPGSAVTLLNRGGVKLHRNDHAGAIEDLNRALAIDPRLDRAYHTRGEVFIEQGRYAEAIADFDRALAIDPRRALSFLQRGNAHRLSGDPRRALSDFDQAIRLDPRFGRTYVDRGQAWFALGETKRAIADYDKAIALDRTLGRAYYHRAVAKHRRGDRPAALRDLELASKHNPRLVEPHIQRGIILGMLGRASESFAAFDQAIKVDPNNARAHFNRGITHLRNKAPQKGIADLSSAIRLRPDYRDAYRNRGAAHLGLGNHTEAERDYRRAIKLGPDHRYVWRAWVGLGRALAGRGQREAALDALGEALKRTPARSRAAVEGIIRRVRGE